MSRPRSAPARGSSAQQRQIGRQVMVPTARSDVYVTLLGVSMAAILIGCILLGLVMRRDDFKVNSGKNASLMATSNAVLAEAHPGNQFSLARL